MKRTRSELKAIINKVLGFYDFDRPRVILPGEKDRLWATSTAFHESLHLELFTTTTFGLLQYCLACLAENKGLDSKHRHRMSVFFELALDKSLMVHEGAATQVQIGYIQSKSPTAARDYLSGKPEIYRKGFDAITEVAGRLQFDNVHTDSINDALIRSLLDAPVVHLIPELLDVDLTKFRECLRDNAPNVRLRKLSLYTRQKNNLQDFRDRLVQKFNLVPTASNSGAEVPEYWRLKRALDGTLTETCLAVEPFTEQSVRIVDSLQFLNERGEQSAVGPFKPFKVEWTDIDGYEDRHADVDFVPAPIPADVAFHAFSRVLSASEAAETVSKLSIAMLRGREASIHVHLGIPQREGLPIHQPVEDECVAVCSAYTMDRGTRNTNHLVVRLPPDGAVEFLLTLRRLHRIAISIPIVDFLLPGWEQRPVWVASTILRLASTQNIFAYSHRNGLMSLIEYWKAIRPNEKELRAYPHALSHFDMLFLMIVQKSPRLVSYFPLSWYGFSRFVKWADPEEGGRWLLTGDEAAREVERLESSIAIDHYCWMGF